MNPLTITVPLYVMVVHFFADFMLQNDWMAHNKSKRLDALVVHVTIYSSCFLFLGWQFAVITFWAHMLTDAITSRINRRLWEAKQSHWFFVGVGFDQLIHFYTLAYTFQYWVVQ